MRKRKKGRKFHRKKDQRKALLKSLAREFFLRGKIKTTQAKAKELRSFAERIITKAKKDDLKAIRYLRKYFDQRLTKKIIKKIAPLYKERKGGYTRILKLPPRKSNGAKMAIIELVEK